MKGSVRKKGATWSYRINLGIISGKRKQKEKSGFKTKRDAQAALARVLNEYNTTGEVFEVKKISFHDVYQKFMDTEAPITRKYSTIKRYSSLYKNHIFDHFGDLNISTISVSILQSYLSEKSSTNSAEYVRSIYNFLCVLFKFAIRMDYIREDITLKVIPPKNPRAKDVVIYTLEQLEILTNRLESTNLQPAFQLAINLGVRAGECYALTWSDIDWNTNTIKINKQLQYYNKRWSFTSLKTEHSYRTIRFSNNLRKYLLDLKSKQETAKSFYSDSFKKNVIYDSEKKKYITVNDLINIKPNGTMLNTYSHKIISRITKSEFNFEFKFHNLRHTHATLLLEKGLNPKYIQKRLGHSKLEFTLKMYTHITDNMDNQASEILNETLHFPQDNLGGKIVG